MTFLPRDFQKQEQVSGPDASIASSPIALTKVRGQTCQWIEGAVSGDDGCKCGKPVTGGLPGRAPYCPDHASRCFESASAWKKRNAWLKDLDGGFAQMTLRDWMGDQE